MSRNKLVSDLFEQEFNKEENYKAIMRRIDKSQRHQHQINKQMIYILMK